MEQSKTFYRAAAFWLVAAFIVSSIGQSAIAQAAAPNNSTPVIYTSSVVPANIAVGTPIVFQVSAFDPDNDPLTFGISPAIANSTFDTATGLFAWTPSASQAGTQTITFSVTDGIDTATLTQTFDIISVAPNQSPIISPINNISVVAGQVASFTVAATDPENSPLTYAATNLPAGASFNTITRTFNWSPTAAQVGSYQVTISVSDGVNTTAAQITITVTAASVTPNKKPNEDHKHKRFFSKYQPLKESSSRH